MINLDYKQDVLFCNVREDKILSAKPILNEKVVKQWFFHQKERTSIYYKKEILNLDAPWTDDEILAKYKFVNTKRTWDRESKWLLKNITSNNKLSYNNKLLNCFLFRVINKSQTFELLNGAIDFENLTLEKINTTFRSILSNKEHTQPDYVFFSAAYILGGPKVNFGKYINKVEAKTEPNMILRMIKFVYYNQDSIINGVLKSKNQNDVYNHLCSYNGIGKFLSYQIFIDFTYIKEFRFTEHNFVISGPGCERGLNWIFTDRDGLTSEECLFWFSLNQHKIAKEYNIDWDMDKIFSFLNKDQRVYTLMDMENSGACEVDKRCRTLYNNKRPKQVYKVK